MKISKILAAGIAATMAVTSLAAVTSAAEKTFSMNMSRGVVKASKTISAELPYLYDAANDLPASECGAFKTAGTLTFDFTNAKAVTVSWGNGYEGYSFPVSDGSLKVEGLTLKITGIKGAKNNTSQVYEYKFTDVNSAGKVFTLDLGKGTGFLPEQFVEITRYDFVADYKISNIGSEGVWNAIDKYKVGLQIEGVTKTCTAVAGDTETIEIVDADAIEEAQKLYDTAVQTAAEEKATAVATAAAARTTAKTAAKTAKTTAEGTADTTFTTDLATAVTALDATGNAGADATHTELLADVKAAAAAEDKDSKLDYSTLTATKTHFTPAGQIAFVKAVKDAYTDKDDAYEDAASDYADALEDAEDDYNAAVAEAKATYDDTVAAAKADLDAAIAAAPKTTVTADTGAAGKIATESIYVNNGVDYGYGSASLDDLYPFIERTTDETKQYIDRNNVAELSNTQHKHGVTQNVDTKATTFSFEGLASQMATFFNKQLNGTVTFKFKDHSTTSSWVNGGVYATEAGLKNALGGTSFALFVNYNSTSGDLQSPGVVDKTALTVTFDISDILDQLGGATIGTIQDVWYGMNNGVKYGKTDALDLFGQKIDIEGKIGYLVEEVTLAYDEDGDADADVEDDADDADDVDDADDADDVDDADDADDVDDADDADDAVVDDADDADDAGEVGGEVVVPADDDDANPGTGVALAVIPALVAGAAVVISKKRK